MIEYPTNLKDTPMPLIIALTGRRRAGKTTTAEWLVRAFGARSIRIHDALHTGVVALYDVDPAKLDGPAKDLVDQDTPWGLTPREMMIRFGEAARRAFGPDVFVLRMARQIVPALAHHQIVVVDNVRTPIELDWLSRCVVDELPPKAKLPVWLTVKLVCADDAPDAREDGVDEIAPDLTITIRRWHNADAFLHEVMAQLVAFLGRQPDLLPYFDPGEDGDQ